MSHEMVEDNHRSRRAAFAVVTTATVWLAVALCWCLFRMPAAGHDNISGSRTIIAENMLRWHIWGPIRDYFVGQPGHEQYYAHHPFGSFWAMRLMAMLFGAKPWAMRLTSIAMTVAVPPMLFGIGRRLWGLWPGVLCAAAYVTLPITLAFGDFPGFEVPLIFGVVLASWGYVRMSEEWNRGARRWGLVSLIGVAYAIQVDWEALVFLAPMLAILAAAAWFLPPRVFGAVHPRRFGGWWAIATVVTAATLFGYLLYLHRIGLLNDMLAQEGKRSRGNEADLEDVLRGDVRSYWIDLMFTPVVVTVGKIAALVLALRVLFLRRIREAIPLCILFMSIVWYVKFKNGADVHIYWPQPFAAYYAMAVGAMAATLLGVARELAARFPRLGRRGLAPRIALGLMAAVVMVTFPDSLYVLRYERASGGRFNEKGRHTWREMDKTVALQWMSQRMVGEEPVLTHNGLHGSWAVEWALHRPLMSGGTAVPAAGRATDARYYVADLRQMGSPDQERLFSTMHVSVVGPYAFADREEAHAPLDAYAIDAREPSAWEWYVQYGVDPVRTIRPDPWETWELRNQYGQTPNPPPPGEPTTDEEVRIAHNVALAAGDASRAAQYRQRLIATLDPSIATKFDDGTELLGRRFTRGVEPELALYFVAAGPTQDETQFDMTSEVERAWFFTLVPPDPLVKAAGTPFLEPPKTWKKGFLYVDRNEVRHRPGREAFYGQFTGKDRNHIPKRLDGETDTLLLTLD